MRRKCGNAEDLKATAQKRIEYAPRPLPERRPRALTVSSIGVGSEKTSSRWSWNPFRNEAPQRTFDQLQSPLIAKLPKELRLLIWKEVVGGHWLHIVRARKRLLAIKCTENPERGTNTHLHDCWGTLRMAVYRTPGFYSSPNSRSSAAAANILSLLKACRIV